MPLHRKTARRPARRAVRDQRLIAFFTLVLVVSGSAVGTRVVMAQTPPVAVVEDTVQAGPDGNVTIQFVGDTMLGDGAQPLIDRSGYDWPMRFVAPLLDGDYVVANIETPITTIRSPWNTAKAYFYGADPASAEAIARAGIDALGLGNNHAMDVGPQGVTDTATHASAAGMAAFGAGQVLAEAERPLLLRTPLGTVGVVSLGENYGPRVRADLATPGTVAMSPQTIQRGVDLARAAGADWVIATVHWGENYEGVTDKQRARAEMFAKAGYDAVIGHGPHVAQPVEFIGTMPVFYSIGNFVFGAPGRYRTFNAPGFGLVAGVELRPGGGATLTAQCLMTNNRVVDYVPRECGSTQGAAVLKTLTEGFTVLGNLAERPCACFSRRP